jgi:hypothetical protein
MAESLVLTCNAKTWFTTSEQMAMGTGSAGPAYAKAREIYSFAYAVRWQSPSPDSTSDLAKAMDKDIQAAAAVAKALEGYVSAATILSYLTELEKLCSSIVANDNSYASTGKRESVVAQISLDSVSKCGILHPLECAKDIGGAIFGWAVIGAVAYFGGKWALNKIVAGKAKKITRRARPA